MVSGCIGRLQRLPVPSEPPSSSVTLPDARLQSFRAPLLCRMATSEKLGNIARRQAGTRESDQKGNRNVRIQTMEVPLPIK